MAVDMRRTLRAAIDAALDEVTAPEQPPAKKPWLSTGRALLLGAGVMTVGRLATSSRGRELLEAVQQRVPVDGSQILGRDDDAEQEDPEDLEDEDLDDVDDEAGDDLEGEEEDEPEAESEEDVEDEGDVEGSGEDDLADEDEEPEADADGGPEAEADGEPEADEDRSSKGGSGKSRGRAKARTRR